MIPSPHSLAKTNRLLSYPMGGWYPVNGFKILSNEQVVKVDLDQKNPLVTSWSEEPSKRVMRLVAWLLFLANWIVLNTFTELGICHDYNPSCVHSEGRVDPTPRWHRWPTDGTPHRTEFESQGFEFLISLEFGEVDRYPGVRRVQIVCTGNLGGFVMLLNGWV